MTLAEVITDAYIKNGVIAPGESVPGELSDYALRESNRQLDQWNIQADFIWTEDIEVFDLTARTPPTYWYTIGPHDVDPTTDFDAPRPVRIDRANLLLESSNPSSRVGLNIRNDMQWSDVTTPALGTTIPTDLYNDGSNPVSRLYIWPYPTVTQNQLELFVWHMVSRFAAVTDEFVMPPGYEDAFMLSLSERLPVGVRGRDPALSSDAAKARANVKSLNSSAPKISTTDSGMPGSRRTTNGNFFNGWPVSLGN